MSMEIVLVHGPKLSLPVPCPAVEHRSLFEVELNALMGYEFDSGIKTVLNGLWWSIEAERIVEEMWGTPLAGTYMDPFPPGYWEEEWQDPGMPLGVED